MEIVAVSDSRGEARVDTRALAERMGNAHASVMRLVKQYETAFRGFGQFGFEIETVRNSAGAVNEVQFARLNEDQCYFLLTLVRNSDQTIPMKAALVQAFRAARTTPVLPNTPPPLISARLAAVALDCSSKSAANRLRHRGIQASHHYLEPLCGAPAFLYPLVEVQKVWPNIQFQPYTGLIHEGTGEVEHRVLLSKQGKAAQAQHLFFNAAEELGAQLARTMVEEFINTELPARLRAALSRGVSA